MSNIKHVLGASPSRTLQLIAPVQVELLKATEFNGTPYAVGDILTVEKQRGIKMVQKGDAKQCAGAVDPARSANRYTVEGGKAPQAVTQEPVTESRPVESKPGQTEPKGEESKPKN